MFRANPETFKDPVASSHVAKGYALEEKRGWVLVSKRIEGKIFYVPCRDKDIVQAEKEGWRFAQYPELH